MAQIFKNEQDYTAVTFDQFPFLYFIISNPTTTQAKATRKQSALSYKKYHSEINLFSTITILSKATPSFMPTLKIRFTSHRYCKMKASILASPTPKAKIFCIWLPSTSGSRLLCKASKRKQISILLINLETLPFIIVAELEKQISLKLSQLEKHRNYKIQSIYIPSTWPSSRQT